MNARQKAERTGLLFLALLLIGGAVLMYRGNDAVALGASEKEGILTAEQVKMAFHSVSGRLVKVHVTEGDVVKKGDVVMEIDAKDTDLAIKKTKAQIAQLDAQIASTSGAQAVNYLKADNDETQSFRQIDQQRAAVAGAQATLRNAQLDYDRKASLVEAGAIAQSQLDDATMTLNVAQAGVEQQQQLLDKLLAGAQDTGATDGIALPTIAQERASAANMSNDVAALESQRQALVVALEELETQKERLTLRAPEDGKILKVLSKEGEMVSAGTPVVLLESNRSYYDIYLSEEQAAGLAEGDEVTGLTVARLNAEMQDAPFTPPQDPDGLLEAKDVAAQVTLYQSRRAKLAADQEKNLAAVQQASAAVEGSQAQLQKYRALQQVAQEKEDRLEQLMQEDAISYFQLLEARATRVEYQRNADATEKNILEQQGKLTEAQDNMQATDTAYRQDTMTQLVEANDRY